MDVPAAGQVQSRSRSPSTFHEVLEAGGAEPTGQHANHHPDDAPASLEDSHPPELAPRGAGLRLTPARAA
eukprot:394999-Alexandrium_andersonii.AAC.1